MSRSVHSPLADVRDSISSTLDVLRGAEKDFESLMRDNKQLRDEVKQLRAEVRNLHYSNEQLRNHCQKQK